MNVTDKFLKYLKKIIKYLGSRERLIINLSRPQVCIKCGHKSSYFDIYDSPKVYKNINILHQKQDRLGIFVFEKYEFHSYSFNKFKSINDYLQSLRNPVMVKTINISGRKSIDNHVKTCELYCTNCDNMIKLNQISSQKSPHVFLRKLK